MHKSVRVITCGSLLALQAFGILYVALICWVMAQWMKDESWAFFASPIDWWRAAGFRFVGGASVGLLVALVLAISNKLLARIGLSFSRIGPWHIAIGALCVIAAASAIGAIQFAIEKPFM